MIGNALRILVGYLTGTGNLEPLEFGDVPYPYPEKIVDGKKHKLCYVSAGSGRGSRILFLHPGSGDVTAFAPQMAALSKKRKVGAVDLPGHGKSRRVTEPTTPEDMALEVWAAMDRLSEKKLSLVGNSLGGGVALSMALQHPERVDKLVLIAAPGTRRTNALERTLFSLVMGRTSKNPSMGRLRFIIEGLMFHRPCVASGALVEKMLRLKAGKDYAQWRQSQQFIMESILHFNVLDRLHEITIPTLILWGRQDRMMPLSEANRFNHRIADSKLVFIDRCGHLPQLEQPEQVTRALSSFLL